MNNEFFGSNQGKLQHFFWGDIRKNCKNKKSELKELANELKVSGTFFSVGRVSFQPTAVFVFANKMRPQMFVIRQHILWIPALPFAGMTILSLCVVGFNAVNVRVLLVASHPKMCQKLCQLKIFSVISCHNRWYSCYHNL